jgi:CRP/FNR family transcriptional regulator, cyclic AMP receptor protein
MSEAAGGVAAFLPASSGKHPERQLLVVPQWQEADWNLLFSYTRRVRVASGEVLIRRDASERALYFVASGLLEVTGVIGSDSLGAIATVYPGSVIGELSFLDGEPRSAHVWAVADSELYRLDSEDFHRYADAHPRRACDLLLAIGRIVALRLRHSQKSVSQRS